MSINDKKIQTICDAITEFGVLIGERDKKREVKNADGTVFYPGLGLKEDAKIYERMAGNIREGVFNVLIMGAMSAGKSTTINAVIGKEVVPTRPTSTTGIITLLIYGRDTKHATIKFNDGRDPQKVTVEEFTSSPEYQNQKEDIEEIESVGYVRRFEPIEYAVIECDHDMVKGGVKIVDSPGLEDSIQATRVTNGFVPLANATIFMIGALRPFGGSERKYIREKFAGKRLKNVFFLINQFNLLPMERQKKDVIDAAETHLKPVFTDADGNFNKELFDKRVFYVNSWGAYLDKLIKTAENDEGTALSEQKRKLIKEMNGIDDDTFEKMKAEGDSAFSKFEQELTKAAGDPAFSEFERELMTFLNCDEKMFEMFNGHLRTMAMKYQDAEKLIENNHKAYQLSIDELKENHKKAVKILNGLDKEFSRIKKDMETGSLQAVKEIIDLINEYVNNDLKALIDSEDFYGDEARIDEIKFSAADARKVLYNSAKGLIGDKETLRKENEKLSEPIAEYAERYIMDILNKELQPKTRYVLDGVGRYLETTVSSAIRDIYGGLESAGEVFSGQDGDTAKKDINRHNSYISECIKDAMKDLDINFVKKIPLIGATVKPILGVLYNSLQAIFTDEKSDYDMDVAAKKHILKKLAPAVIAGLHDTLTYETEEKIKSSIELTFDKMFDDLTRPLRNCIKEEEENQKTIIREMENQTLNSEDAHKRETLILSKMFESMNIVHSEVYGKPLTREILDGMLVE